ncbi:hypothetical protein BGX26_006340, partial [Mortierella sp. AD094]
MHTNPLDLPEIQLILAAFLDNSDLAHCILVCKSWSRAFEPVLYSVLDVTEREVGKTPSLDSICSHARHIHHIVTGPKTRPQILAMNFSNLSTLEIVGYCSRSVDLCVAFLRQHHSSLQNFDFKEYYHLPIKIWETLADTSLFPKLASFSIVDASLNGWDEYPNDNLCAAAFWKACTRFKSLELTGIRISHQEDCWPVFNHLESLYLFDVLGLTITQYMAWLTNCLRLQSLSWSPHNEEIQFAANGGDYDYQR